LARYGHNTKFRAHSHRLRQQYVKKSHVFLGWLCCCCSASLILSLSLALLYTHARSFFAANDRCMNEYLARECERALSDASAAADYMHTVGSLTGALALSFSIPHTHTRRRRAKMRRCRCRCFCKNEFL